VSAGTPIALAEAVHPLILTIDIGTSSVRTLLYDGRARLVAGVAAQERYGVRSTADGASEDDPAEALARVERCVDTALAQAGPLADRIGAVALDTLVSNIMAVDRAGRPLTPLVTYADTRNAADAAQLQRELDERAVHQRTGCLLRTSYWPARLAWFRRTQPGTWRAAAGWITIGEYLERRLFGASRVSYSVASWGGLLDRRALAWDAPLLDHLGLQPSQLAPLADVSAPLRGLSGRGTDGRPYAERWPALRDVPWFPAIGDGAAANIGSGCTGPGRIALTVGTTGALRVVLNSARDKQTSRQADKQTGSANGSQSPSLPVSQSPGLPVSQSPTEVPAGLWCYRVDGRRALLGGATSEGGNVYAWLRQTLSLGEPEAIERALAEQPPDSHGLTVLPFLAGERSPGWAGDARATIHGLGLNTAPIEILRASLEAVAYRFALIGHALLQDQRQATCVASGGALLSSPTWMQIIADTLGRPVVASEEREATSRGVALLALESLGAIATVDELPAADGEVYQPNPANHAIYQDAIARQRELYDRFYARPQRSAL
jgi:gluconokinase